MRATIGIYFILGVLHPGMNDFKLEGSKEFKGKQLWATEKWDQITFCSLPANNAPLLIQNITGQ